jgi:hypothetical protein
MKLFLRSIFRVIATMYEANATLAVRVVFSNGMITSSIYCTAAEWVEVQDAIDIGCTSGASGRDDGDDTHHSRQLTNCQAVCASFPPGLCYLSGTGCHNRRTLQESASKGALVHDEAELKAEM